MARYRLHSAEQVKELPASGQRGPLVVWQYELEDAQGNRCQAEALKKPDNAPPIGEFVDGTVSENEYGKKFKADPPPREGRGSRSPADTAAIQRQHSQEMALRFAAATGWLDELDLMDDAVVAAALNGPIRRATDFFERDIARTNGGEQK